MTNKLTNIHDFDPYTTSFVSLAKGKSAPTNDKGKLNLVSCAIESNILYVHYFLFQSLYVQIS